MNSKDRHILKEAINGFGFVEVEQHPEGTYCEGCLYVHKRPTKMYYRGGGDKGKYCAHALIRFFNPEEGGHQ